MSITHQAPSFSKSSAVTPSDGTDNCNGCLGIHNSSATAGVVKVLYRQEADADIGTLYLLAGQSVFAPIRRVRATATTAGAIEALYL